MPASRALKQVMRREKPLKGHSLMKKQDVEGKKDTPRHEKTETKKERIAEGDK